MLRLLVGLGNPGPEYEGTRHNAGFAWIDAAAPRLNARLAADRAYRGQVVRVVRAGEPLWLLKPQTYMNLSGQSVAALARFFKIAPAEILVVHDELDLPPGQMRLKQGGGVAGHNGLKDIRAQLGSADFWRLRLGIGHPGDRAEVADYVLRRAPADERQATEDCIAKSMAALDLLLAGEMQRATMQLHAPPPRPKPPPQPKPSGPGAATAPPLPAIESPPT